MSLIHRQACLRRLALACPVCPFAAVTTGTAFAQGNGRGSYGVTDAKQEIEELRRLYAIATDLLGRENDPVSLAKGEEIYHRIFTVDADIKTMSNGVIGRQAVGPAAWAVIVKNALGTNFVATQHMIGTQYVEIEQMPNGQPDGPNANGTAEMSSYL